MESDTEKYPVCPHRNIAAAFRWFYQPTDRFAFLKRRPPGRAFPAPLVQRERAPATQS